MAYQLGAFLGLPRIEPREIKGELEKYQRAGVKMIGLAVDYPNGPENSSEWLPALKRGLKAVPMKVVIHAPFVGFNLMALSPAHREASISGIRQTMDIAKELGAQIVTIHAGESNKFSEPGDRARKVLKDSLTQLLDYASVKGVRLSVENMPVKRGGFSATYPVTVDESEELTSKFKGLELCMDIGHWRKSGIDVYDSIRRLAVKSNCIHLHDATATEDHLGAGRGDMDFGRVLASLTFGGFEGAALVEVPNSDECLETFQKLKMMMGK